jgi:hypothetical protein
MRVANRSAKIGGRQPSMVRVGKYAKFGGVRGKGDFRAHMSGKVKHDRFLRLKK